MTRSLAGAYALTLKNPWAHLIAHHGKDVENRTWMPHAGVNTLLIHAGKGWDTSINIEYAGVATSAIVAVADLAFACEASRWTLARQCGCSMWAMGGQCHWNLTNVVALPEPVPVTGRQGLWRPDRATLDAVQAQLVAVRS